MTNMTGQTNVSSSLLLTSKLSNQTPPFGMVPYPMAIQRATRIPYNNSKLPPLTSKRQMRRQLRLEYYFHWGGELPNILLIYTLSDNINLQSLWLTEGFTAPVSDLESALCLLDAGDDASDSAAAGANRPLLNAKNPAPSLG